MICYTFIGIQGSGKGTQAIKLSKYLNFQHINTGDLFRNHIINQTELGKHIQSIIAMGDLVSDDIVFELVQTSVDVKTKGLIFDGFPRTVLQAEYLLQHYEVKRVYFLQLDEQIALERISSRRICSKCPENYNIITKPSLKANICDKCGSPLIVRQDDQPEAVRKRFRLFHEETRPLIELFRDRGVLSIINANQQVEEIFGRIISEI
jgi:adenylate kinase